jgi:predicted permease
MGLWSRFARTLHGGQHRAEIEEELRFHLEMEAAGGRDPREARVHFGNVAKIQEDTRAAGIFEWLESAWRDARYGVRQLRRTPALTIAVLLSLAIGIGANTAIFSLVDAAILKPLPVSDPSSLAVLEWTHQEFPPGVHNINGEFRRIAGGRRQGSSVSAAVYRRFAREQTTFATIVGIADPDTIAITVPPSLAEQLSVQYVSGNFFQGVGVAPIVGRGFSDDDDRVGAEPVVIVSHRWWLNRLGGDRTALNRGILVNHVPARIVGVAPASFFGLHAGQWTDVFAPLAARVAFQPPPPGQPVAEDDHDWWVRQLARLKPGTTAQAATAEAAGLFRRLAMSEGADGKAVPPELVSVPGRHGFNWLGERDRNALWMLSMMVGVLLLIVCVNVANLLLSRSVARQRESAMRLALGASRLRLFRQHVIESTVLATLGGAAGLGVGYALAVATHGLFQAGLTANNAFDLHIDPRILAYTAGISMITALLFGVAPSMRAAAADLHDTLKAQTRSVIGGRFRIARLLVALQIGLCLAALMCAGLLARTLDSLTRVDLGFEREHLAYVSMSPARSGYTPDRMGPYADRIRDALLRIPGVTRVSSLSFRPLASMGNNGSITFAGRPSDPSHRANLNSVGDGFFETMGIPIVAGRAIQARDIHPDATVAVVDKIFVERYSPNENPIGRRFGYGQDDNRFEIVGVVGNSRYNTMRGDVYPTVYEPFVPSRGPVRFAIRAALDPAALADDVRRAVASVDPTVPVTEFHTQTALVDRMLRSERLLSVVATAFGVIALTLAAIGLGGLLAYTVARRTNEIGVRVALGAAANDVVGLVLRDSLSMVGAGLVVGAPLAYMMARMLSTWLFSVEPFDPLTMAASAAILITVGFVAAWLPARRAAHVDPLIALRAE